MPLTDIVEDIIADLAITTEKIANGAVTASKLSANAVSLPRTYFSGFNTSNGADADHDIDILAGECRDIDNSFDMVFASPTTIAIDAVAGIKSISTGVVAADTPYGIWAWEDSTGVASPVRGYTFDVVDD